MQHVTRRRSKSCSAIEPTFRGTERRQRLLGLASLASLLVAPRALAQVKDLQLTYEAPTTCPSAAEFIAEVNQRREVTPRFDEPRSFHIQLSQDGSRAVGTLRVRAYGADTSTRTVEAKSCREVSVALALVTALTLDTAPPPAPHVAAPVSTRHPAGPEPANAIGRETDPAARGWWGVGLHVDALAGVLPRLAAAPRLFVDARLERSGMWTPALRLSAAYAQLNTEGVQLRWTAGRIDLCFGSLKVSEEASLWPCPTFEAGTITASNLTLGGVAGDGLDPRLWLALGGIARLQWILFGVVLLEFEGGASLPMARQPLQTVQGVTLYPNSLVSAHFGVGLGARFP